LYLERHDMDQLCVRRQTYMLWPGWAPRSVQRDRLAGAGFYYTGEADAVRCYACRETFSGWKDGDVPLDVHRRRCPTCHVVVSLDRKHPPSKSQPSPKTMPPPPPTFDHHEAVSVKLPADVEVDGPTGKTATEDCVNVAARQMNTSSRSSEAATTNLSKLGKLLQAQFGRRHRSRPVGVEFTLI